MATPIKDHGEQMDSYELLYTLADAGYSCNFLDLLSYDIPADCELLITVDPKQDLTDKGASDISEVQKIKDFLDEGKNYMVFLSPDSFASGGFENFEALLEEWGADFAHTKGESGSEEYYQIKDSSHATSLDGYTIFGQSSNELFSGITSPAIFKNTTCINISDAYAKSESGYTANIDGRERVFTPLITSYSTAQAYAGGKVVKKATDEPFTLMSMTEQNYNGKTSRVFVCASVDFASQEYMQSTVYGNNEIVSAIARETGMENAPYMLKAKPFPTTVMQSVTTKTATTVTVCLASFFALAAAISGAVILIKRKNAM